MKKLLLAIPILFLIYSCGDKSEIEDAIKNELKDPASVQFRNMSICSNGKVACIEWNAKNSMGGYGGFHEAILIKNNSRWSVLLLKSVSGTCGENYANNLFTVQEQPATKHKDKLDSVIVETQDKPGQVSGTSATSEKPVKAPGTVIETMNASGYTFVLIDDGEHEIWASCPEMPMKVGDKVIIPEGTTMVDFESKTLHRTFKSLIFTSSIIERVN